MHTVHKYNSLILQNPAKCLHISFHTYPRITAQFVITTPHQTIPQLTVHYSLQTASSPAATPVSPVPLIQHSTLSIQHWSYTFSAKEKDSETSLSYFGSRYYSSDLSVWLSVDPQASKYPSLSPYVYCADNPVKLVDPNGEDFVTIIDDKNKTITIKATYYAANKDKKLLQQGIDLWMQQSEKYSYTMEKDGQSIPYTIKFDLSIAEGDYATSFDAKSAMPTHQGMNFFEVLPEVKGSDNNPIRGKCISGFGINVSNDYTLAGYDPVRTAAHEIGHSLGCADTFLQDDLMVSGGRGSAIGINNIRAIMFMGGFDNFGFANVGNDNGHSANAHKLGTYFGTVIKN